MASDAKQTTHNPELKAELKKLADARKVLSKCEEAFERDAILLGQCRIKMQRLQTEIGSLMVSVPGWEQGTDSPDRAPIKIKIFLQQEIDEINRLLG